MKQEEQNVAIAIVCGWRLPNKGERCGDFDTGDGIFTPEGWPWWIKQIPNYVTDLNEMYEAEKILTRQQRRMYVCELQAMCSNDPFTSHSASSDQRTEAFLKTLNLWKE